MPRFTPRSTTNSSSSSSNSKQSKCLSTSLLVFLAFLLGGFLSGTTILHLSIEDGALEQYKNDAPTLVLDGRLPPPASALSSAMTPTTAVLQNIKILVVLVAFDFSQIPHLEEVLDSYHDIAVAGARVDVVIHATVAYPVVWLDMWNDRFTNAQFTLTISIRPSSLRLHLVDCHRHEFYSRLEKYDMFIYSEDDIRITPTTVASYLVETQKVEELLSSSSSKFKPSDFNVGVVRYEYDFPANVVMDDKTRHATQNVTRVYWEHSGFQRPVVPNIVTAVPQEPLSQEYVTMKNHHQGMYLATRSLLQAWKERCQFDVATNRPGKGSQPTEGTQRVWMSSQQLYGGRHCNVQQVLPTQRFGSLTVLHLPNKNYRRVGKYRSRVFSDGTEVFEKPHDSLLKAMELHVALKQAFPKKAVSRRHGTYTGIRMVDQVDKPRDRTHVLERRMKEFNAYVQRGGVLTEADMDRTSLLEP